MPNLQINATGAVGSLYLTATTDQATLTNPVTVDAEFQASLQPGNLDTATQAGEYTNNPGDFPPDPQTGVVTVPATALDKIPTQQSELTRPVLAIQGYQLTIGGLDFSVALESVSVESPISGVTQGVLSLQRIRGLPGSLDPEDGFLIPGRPVSLVATIQGTDVPLFTGFIVEPAQYTIKGRRQPSVTLRIGDRMMLSGQSDTSDRQPYCGEAPKFARDATVILATKRRLGELFNVPRGQRLETPILNEYLEDSPVSLLQRIWAPSNRDIRTLPSNGQVSFPLRQPYNPDTAIPINWREVQSGSWDTGTQLPYSRVTVACSYRENRGFEETVTSYEVISPKFNPADERAWFISDSIKTRYTETQRGDTVVSRKKEILGWIPDQTQIDQFQANASGSACDDGSLVPVGYTTTFGVVETEETVIYTEPHPSGAELVNAERKWRYGYGVYDSSTFDPQTGLLTGRFYNLYQGILEDDYTLYGWFRVADARVCRKNHIILYTDIQRTQSTRVDLKDGSEPALEVRVIEETTYKRNRSAQVAQGESRPWRKSYRKTEWVEELNKFLEQPSQDSQEDPPNAKWVRPLLVPINLEREVQITEVAEKFGDRPAPPLSSPYTYTPDQLREVGRRYLRETAGRSQGITLAYSPLKPVSPGDSILYTREDGRSLPYIVASVEWRLQNRVATQILTCWRWYG